MKLLLAAGCRCCNADPNLLLAADQANMDLRISLVRELELAPGGFQLRLVAFMQHDE
jgi:hypothetical protein